MLPFDDHQPAEKPLIDPSLPSTILRVGDLFGESAADHHDIGSLLSFLPIEIISEIFVSSCTVNKTPFPRQTYTLTPLRLSHVCRLWRRLALTTPRLWTHLYASIHGSDINPAIRLSSLWITRSRALPLRIELDFSSAPGALLYPSDTLLHFRNITRYLMASIRARENVETTKSFFEAHVRASSIGVVPILEQKYLWYYGADKSPDEDWEVQGSKRNKKGITSPLLTVRGSRRSVAEFGFHVHEPLSTALTVLDLQDTNGISNVSSLELAVILDEFPLLRRVSAHIDQGDMPNPPTLLAVRAVHLRILRLSWIYPADIGLLLDAITAPNLTELALLGDVPSGLNAWNHLLSFFRRSHPPLRRLDLEHFDGVISRLGLCLQECSELERLWIESCILNDDFIAGLGYGGASGSGVLSTLKTLGLIGIAQISGECLLRTLVASKTILKEIFVVDCDGVKEEHCDSISRYFGSGKINASGSILVLPMQ